MIVPYDFDQKDWGSRKIYSDLTLKPWKVDKSVLHWGGHTYPGDPTWSLEKMIKYEMSVLRAIQDIHIDQKLWVDIAYSYAAGNSGMRYRLRGENRAAATSGDFDGDGIPENVEARALFWIGGLGYVPTRAAFEAMGTMIEQSNPVTLHWEHKPTLCPGKDWAAWRDRKGWLSTPEAERRHQMRTVRYGMGSWDKRDSTVAAMQAAMKSKGHPDKNTIDTKCGIDGIARSGTVNQIKSYQKANGLAVDGVCGRTTWEELDKE